MDADESLGDGPAALAARDVVLKMQGCILSKGRFFDAWFNGLTQPNPLQLKMREEKCRGFEEQLAGNP